MKKLIYGATAIILVIGLLVPKISLTRASFFDKDSAVAESLMAGVDIELDKISFIEETACFTVNNNSNTDIYLRVGVIFEARTLDGSDWAIADLSGINITDTSDGWTAVQKTVTDDLGNSYVKWFLEYADEADYTPVSPGIKQLEAAFNVTTDDSGYTLSVNIVPEAVQAGISGEALNDLKSSQHAFPSW